MDTKTNGSGSLRNMLELTFSVQGKGGEVRLTPQLTEAYFFFEIAVAAEIPLLTEGSLLLHNVSMGTLQNLQAKLPSTITGNIILSLRSNDITWVAGVARSKYLSYGPVEENPEYGITWRPFIETLTSKIVYELSALKDVQPKPGQWFASACSPLRAVYPITESGYLKMQSLARGVEFTTGDRLSVAEDDPRIGELTNLALEMREEAYEPILFYRVKNLQFRKLEAYGFVPPLAGIDEMI